MHAYFVTPEYVDPATAGHLHPDGMPCWPAWSAESHLRLEGEHNIDWAMLTISLSSVHSGKTRP